MNFKFIYLKLKNDGFLRAGEMVESITLSSNTLQTRNDAIEFRNDVTILDIGLALVPYNTLQHLIASFWFYNLVKVCKAHKCDDLTYLDFIGCTTSITYFWSITIQLYR